MIHLYPYTDLYDISPLLQLKIAKYRLVFTTALPVKARGLSALLRSRLGYILKGRFCPFQDYGAVHCSRCSSSPCCFYPVLFDPTNQHMETANIGQGKPQKTPPRPFTIDILGASLNSVLEPGNHYAVELTLLGARAVSFQRPMLESITHALASIQTSRLQVVFDPGGIENPLTPLLWQGLVPENAEDNLELVLTDEFGIANSDMAKTLLSWIRAMPALVLDRDASDVAMMTIELRTPFQLERDKRNLTFTGFMQSVVSRLRDLKRNYHPDNGMGSFSKEFYAAGDRVQVFTDIETARHTWYSYRQKRNVDIGGMQGSLIFKGDLEPFIPLIAAGFLIGVGKKVAYGLGRFGMQQYDLWPPQ
ncbi:MAG: CRISPR system precrRNA processing endoribonuclease RAMP protein Cas6 [Desulfobacter postgatei]|uniref:CRISPR system precrRNA processing endoribonuclease RAMP protein Cas6 n=1 Tax=Desulfobacter postgatei TaxID=2293 RepID=UPI0023F2E853|nr:CRISPR system precrRNA processing endoribonuclease RAMP protein Cas6 [Desulfobacter postgatei]MDD4273323.1 CRISPR system precrRNA processing endoribonuclease RAMP protein Cas6 [Desulfobacter postgatei]